MKMVFRMPPSLQKPVRLQLEDDGGARAEGEGAVVEGGGAQEADGAGGIVRNGHRLLSAGRVVDDEVTAIRPTVDIKNAALGDDSVIYGALALIEG